LARQSKITLPRLKANNLSGNKELDSSHQSNLFLKICSNKADGSAIGRKELLVRALRIGITLNSVQEEEILRVLINFFRIERRSSVTSTGKCFNISGEMLSKPEAIDLWESIAEINSPCVSCILRQWLVVLKGTFDIRLVDNSSSEGT
jgi:hypothetical protein